MIRANLLLPRGGADELSGLEILEVVIRNGGHPEDDRGGEQGIGDQRITLIRRLCAVHDLDEQSGGDHDENATPEIGLLEAPIRPAI